MTQSCPYKWLTIKVRMPFVVDITIGRVEVGLRGDVNG